MLDWRSLVRLRYGVEPTLGAMGGACTRRGWRVAFAVVQGAGPVACRLHVAPARGGDAGAEGVELVGVGATSDEALGRAMLAVPHERPPVTP